MILHSCKAVEHEKLDIDNSRVSKTAASMCLNALDGFWEVETRLGKQRGQTEFSCDDAVAWPWVVIFGPMGDWFGGTGAIFLDRRPVDHLFA